MSDWAGVSVLITGGAGFASSRAPQARPESPRTSLSAIVAVDTASPSIPFTVDPSIKAFLR